jgi:predicted amidophosphoribosyltransferase
MTKCGFCNECKKHGTHMGYCNECKKPTTITGSYMQVLQRMKKINDYYGILYAGIIMYV